jgi:hypothetical protein
VEEKCRNSAPVGGEPGREIGQRTPPSVQSGHEALCDNWCSEPTSHAKAAADRDDREHYDPGCQNRPDRGMRDFDYRQKLFCVHIRCATISGCGSLFVGDAERD